MQISFKENFTGYKSIRNKFEIPEFKNFNVITGLNGSGKTHFLEALKNGNFFVENIDMNLIGFFDYINFRLGNERVIQSQFITEGRIKFIDKL